MNKNKTLLMVALSLVPFVCGAETFTFDAGRGVEDYLTFSKHRVSRPHFSIEQDQDGDLLTFRPENGAGDLALFQPPDGALTQAREIEVVLRTEGPVTFGVFSRANTWDETAYLVFFSPDPDGTARLHLAKTALQLSQKISDGHIANKHVKGIYDEGAWYALRVEMQDVGDDAVDWSAELVHLDDDQTILSVSGEDSSGVITEAAPLGLRFYCGERGSVQIKSISFSD
jgi:hypothetical protein